MRLEPFNSVLARIPEASKVGVDAITVAQIAAVWDEEIALILERMLVEFPFANTRQKLKANG